MLTYCNSNKLWVQVEFNTKTPTPSMEWGYETQVCSVSVALAISCAVLSACFARNCSACSVLNHVEPHTMGSSKMRLLGVTFHGQVRQPRETGAVGLQPETLKLSQPWKWRWWQFEGLWFLCPRCSSQDWVEFVSTWCLHFTHAFFPVGAGGMYLCGNFVVSGVFIPVSHMPGRFVLPWIFMDILFVSNHGCWRLFCFRTSDWCAPCPVYLRWMQYFSFLQFNPQIFPHSKCKERHTLLSTFRQSKIHHLYIYFPLSIAMSDEVCHQDPGSGGIQACPSQRTCAWCPGAIATSVMK